MWVSGICILHRRKSKQGASDKESPKLRDNLERTMDTAIFDKIFPAYDPVIIDLVISRIIAKVSLYYSYTPDPETSGYHAFPYSW